MLKYHIHLIQYASLNIRKSISNDRGPDFYSRIACILYGKTLLKSQIFGVDSYNSRN